MLTLRNDALELLDSTLPLLDEVNRTGRTAWWTYLVAQLDAIERHPALSPFVRDIPPPTWANVLWSEEQIPRELEEWGRRALALVRFMRDTKEPGHLFGPYRVDTHQLFKARQRTCETGHCDYLAAVYVRPIIMWLRAEVRAGADFNAAVERWVQRTERFGVAGHGSGKLNEAAVQNDLHRYLFDLGMEPSRDFDREHQTTRGRVDFLLRNGELVPVELKVWRHGTARPLSPWSFQARTYARDLKLRQAYLVVVNASSARRLERDQGVGNTLNYGNVVLHLRIVDVGRLAPSVDYNKRKPVRVSLRNLRIEPPSAALSEVDGGPTRKVEVQVLTPTS